MFEFFVYLVTVAITPGPNTISSMANAAEKGFKGVTFNLGMLIGITFIASFSFLLISILSKYIPLLSKLLQMLGVIYLVYLGIKMLKKTGSVKEKTGTFIEGMLMQIMNVKVMMLCVTAISEYILPLDISYYEKWLRVFIIPLTCFVCGLFWAVAGSAMKGIYEKRRKMFNSIFALTLFVLATINSFKIFISIILFNNSSF